MRLPRPAAMALTHRPARRVALMLSAALLGVLTYDLVTWKVANAVISERLLLGQKADTGLSLLAKYGYQCKSKGDTFNTNGYPEEAKSANVVCSKSLRAVGIFGMDGVSINFLKIEGGTISGAKTLSKYTP